MSTAAQGRIVARLVSLFEPVEQLVNEKDRRVLEFQEEEEENLEPPTLE